MRVDLEGQVALVTGAALGYGTALAIHGLGPEHPVGAVLLNMAVFGAVISYVLQMISFILLRRRLPEIERPYRSPLGVPGAACALAIAAVTLVSLFVADPVYRNVVVGAAVAGGDRSGGDRSPGVPSLRSAAESDPRVTGSGLGPSGTRGLAPSTPAGGRDDRRAHG